MAAKMMASSMPELRSAKPTPLLSRGWHAPNSVATSTLPIQGRRAAQTVAGDDVVDVDVAAATAAYATWCNVLPLEHAKLPAPHHRCATREHSSETLRNPTRSTPSRT